MWQAHLCWNEHRQQERTKVVICANMPSLCEAVIPMHDTAATVCQRASEPWVGPALHVLHHCRQQLDASSSGASSGRVIWCSVRSTAIVL